MKKNLIQSLFVVSFAFCFLASNAQNEDFESVPTGTITTATQISGWSIYTAAHTFSTNTCFLPQASGTPSSSAVYSTTSGYIDSGIGSGYPIFSLFGSTPGPASAAAANPQLGFAPSGTSFLRLNSSDISVSRIEMARKVVTVTPANSQFDIAYVSVLQGGHACCDAAAFTIKVNNGNCSLLATVCSTVSNVTFYSTLNYQPVSTSNPATQMFNKWKVRTLDLSMYISQTVTVDIIASHCTLGGHSSYAFIDTRFRPATVVANGNTTTLTANSVNTLTSCQPLMVLTAPPNFSNYQWSGPSGFTSTLPTISTSVQGNYVVTANNGNACSAITNSFYLSFASASLQASASSSSICPGNTATLSVTGVTSQTWSPGAQTASSIVVSPSVTTIYTVNGINAFGCPALGTIAIGIFTSASISLQPSSNTPSVCLGATAAITVSATGTPTWQPGSLTGSVIFVSPSVTAIYTVSALNTDGCLVSGSYTLNVILVACASITTSQISILAGNSATLTAFGLSTYTWQTGSNAQSIVVSPLVTTDYSVHGHTAAGAYGVARITQLVEGVVGLKQEGKYISTLIYPNPASKQLFIKPDGGHSKFMLFDLSGRLVLEKNLSNSEQTSVDVSDLDLGFYQIRLITSQGEVHQQKVLLEE